MQPPHGRRGAGLDHHFAVVQRVVLAHQDPITGLLPAHQIAGCENHAWIRDNVYSITAVWALALAYRRTPENDGAARSYLLEKATLKCMRGLLVAMLGQREKVEKFKSTFSRQDSLHAKYCSKTGQPVTGDGEWGHLQIDAVSLFLLSLAQMTAGGLQIIFTLDEVAFVQNLVFYIECAYVTPDYGVWERGAKSNQGIPELNASSIGMAKAALEALSEFDLFGGRGSQASVIHVLPDEAVKCSAVLESMLPRESNSKETDAAVLSIIGFPAFAVNNEETIEVTLETLRTKLQGRYGLKRFLRDGYKTLREDTGRLHYEPWELRVFDNIECEWPLFTCYIAINHMFSGEMEAAGECLQFLDRLAVPTNGYFYLPELYLVPEEGMVREQANPGSSERVAAGRIPFMWSQCLLTIARLLYEGLLAPAELDPMNRRLAANKKPDVVVQVVVLAEDTRVQGLLAEQGVAVQTVVQVAPIEVKPARVLSHLYTFLGRSRKLGLSGRSCLDVGILATSKVYSVQDKLFVFTPQNFDRSSNYADADMSLAVSTLEYSISYLATSWASPGRPTVTMVLTADMMEEDRLPAPVLSALRKLEGGYINGTRVHLGTHRQFIPTSCSTELAFLSAIEEGTPEVLDPEVAAYLASEPGLDVRKGVLGREPKLRIRKRSAQEDVMRGSMRRSRSICPSTETSLDIATELQMLGQEKETPAPVQKVPAPRRRLETERYEEVEVEEVLYTLRVSRDMEVQGDILHYMAASQGMNFETGLGTVHDLLRELYNCACAAKSWGIVRHTSGLLAARTPNVALSLTDLLVRQKQVTVGLPPHHEVILAQPLGAVELCAAITKASNGDMAAATLTQEILVYLAMFVRTEPSLFHGMLRLRVGLILQVMASEFSRSIPGISGEEATDRLLNLSPFETKNLLHHLMSGQEYRVSKVGDRITIVLDSSIKGVHASQGLGRRSSTFSLWPVGEDEGGEEEGEEPERAGLWLRRRLLDGSLNRVPPGFYTRMWGLLDRCQGLEVGRALLPTALTQEMTSGEMAFHLRCEALLNAVQEPEFRQLVVEAILVLVLVVEHGVADHLGGVIRVEEMVREANTLFLADQAGQGGDATLCCTSQRGTCGGADSICQHFYDSAPSGPWGTMAYLVRAACATLNCIPGDGEIDCSIM